MAANYGNTAENKEELLAHALLVKPRFMELLTEFTANLPGVSFLSGPDNACMIKSEESLDFKLKYIQATKIRDMVRTTVICPTITSLHAAVVQFVDHCKDKGLDVGVVNFYDNVAKFGSIDRVDEEALFGYVGVHVTIPLTVGDVTVLAEVQFHPSTIYDGTPTCLKERLHRAYMAFHMKEAQKDKELAARARAMVVMHYAYAMATTPL